MVSHGLTAIFSVFEFAFLRFIGDLRHLMLFPEGKGLIIAFLQLRSLQNLQRNKLKNKPVEELIYKLRCVYLRFYIG